MLVQKWRVGCTGDVATSSHNIEVRCTSSLTSSVWKLFPLTNGQKILLTFNSLAAHDGGKSPSFQTSNRIYRYMLFWWVNRRLEDDSNFTVWFFTDRSSLVVAVFLFYSVIAVNVNDEAWFVIIWFSVLVCATVVRVVGVLQSDVVRFVIRPVPQDALICITTANLSLTL